MQRGLLHCTRCPRGAGISFNTSYNQCSVLESFIEKKKLDPAKKVHKTLRPEDAQHTFPYLVNEAAFLNGPDRTLFLFLLEPQAASLRVLQLSRAEGFRGQEVVSRWSFQADRLLRCNGVELQTSPLVQDLQHKPSTVLSLSGRSVVWNIFYMLNVYIFLLCVLRVISIIFVDQIRQETLLWFSICLFHDLELMGQVPKSDVGGITS